LYIDFFFSSRRRHTRSKRDWSSDVCSSDLYAQIRHGPIEYGKDIAVVVEKDSKRILRLYQAKVGDITVPVWRNATHELEEMFLVDRKSTRLNSSHVSISYAVFCLKKKINDA